MRSWKRFLLACAVVLVGFTADAYLTPLTTMISGQGQFPNGTVGAPAISFVNSPDAGFYRIGSNDIGLSVAGLIGIEMKKSTGAFVNVGFPSASVSDSYPVIFSRLNTSAGTYLQINNPTASANAKASIEVATDSNNLGEISAYTTGSTVPPYIASLVLRPAGDTKHMTIMGGESTTDGEGDIRLYAGGDFTATGQVARVHKTGLQITTQVAKPTCVVALRGTLYYTQSGAGVADQLEMCSKNSSDVYAWVVVKAAP